MSDRIVFGKEDENGTSVSRDGDIVVGFESGSRRKLLRTKNKFIGYLGLQRNFPHPFPGHDRVGRWQSKVVDTKKQSFRLCTEA